MATGSVVTVESISSGLTGLIVGVRIITMLFLLVVVVMLPMHNAKGSGERGAERGMKERWRILVESAWYENAGPLNRSVRLPLTNHSDHCPNPTLSHGSIFALQHRISPCLRSSFPPYLSQNYLRHLR